MPTALVRPPGPRLAEGLVTHIERRPVDVERAERQWRRYVEALQDAGWDTVEVEAAPASPDAVFVEDTVVMFGTLAVITRPGAEERRAETAGTAAVIRRLGYDVATIESPGTLDGGDVLKVGSTVYVGVGGRSDEAGVSQLAHLIRPTGRTVIGVPVTKALHLKSTVTALPDGPVIGFAPLVDDPQVFPRFLAVPEESGAHVVDLGQHRLLMAADAPRSAA
ncbi:MAG: N(G),N(G)-dimethylarginine dimethylaminohydrolase, partial [Frankiaceae bacterium]|nr:N(G),N(G)-dimethylarginine dimethylaminohydrolase [Frankiaceae bacterium]